MLYLRTGLPGASKTLNSIKEIVEDTSLIGRPKFYNNIKLFFLDYAVCDSFQGFFYGVYLPSLDEKQSRKVNKVLLRIHREDELASLEHFPFLRSHFDLWRDGGGSVNLFLFWVKKLYPDKALKELADYLALIENPTFEDIEHFHFHFTRFEDPTGWYMLPKGSVILIDECQQWFPPRPVGSKVPRHCSEFETHRHSGFDVHLITQDAKLLDSHVRRLVGRHIHYHNPLASKKVSRLQGDKVFDPNDYHQKKNTVSSLITRDEKFYGVYWSADLHTHKLYVPKKLIILVCVALVIPVSLAFWAFSRFSSDAQDSFSASFVSSESFQVESHSISSFPQQPFLLPIQSFRSVDHPLVYICDDVIFAGHEVVRRTGIVKQNFYLQCEKSLIENPSSSEDEETQIFSDAFLLDVNYLSRLGYSLKLDRGLLVLEYGSYQFLFPTFI